MFKNLVVALMIVVLSCSLVGCQSQEHLGTFGDLEVHAAYARPIGGPSVTSLVTVYEGEGKLKASFAQKDLMSLGLVGVLGAGSSALHGMTFGMFRRPDKYENHTSTNVSGGGGGGATATAAQAQGQAQGQRQNQRNVNRNTQTQNNGMMPMMPMGGGGD